MAAKKIKKYVICYKNMLYWLQELKDLLLLTQISKITENISVNTNQLMN